MRILYIDVIKIFSAFGVILLHSTAYVLQDINAEEWSAFLLLNTLTRFSVPLFFMCSGALLLSKTFEFTPRNFVIE